MSEKIFYTIRETANIGILPEHALRIMQKQNKLPCIMCGNKCLINYPQLLEQLNEQSKGAVTA